MGRDQAWIVTRRGEFLFTNDGGSNWNRIAAESAGNLNQVYFINPQRGWAISREGQVQSSLDGGHSWRTIADLDYTDAPLARITFVDELHGWLIDLFSIWRTDDGGQSWQRRIPLNNPDQVHEPIRSYFFLTPKNGWLGAEQGAVYRTTDGGESWQARKPISEEEDVFSIFFIDELTGWLCTGAGRIYSSDDGGNTWKLEQERLQNIKLDSIYFADKNEGWAVGSNREASTTIRNEIWGVILHTIDGGKTWQLVDIGERELYYHRVHFTDSENGWLLAHDTVYRTIDGGETWNIVLRLK